MENQESKKQKQNKEKKHQGKLNEFGDQFEKFASRTAESIKKAIDKGMASRNTVLTIRVNDESNKKLNMLVEAGLFKSRSESAAFLIQEGIKKQKFLFDKISSKLDEIDQIKEELQDIINQEFKTQETPSKK
ncbi:hypothetical protein KGY73_04910 [bacterium]|nr:hypothetical protein [bacterium]